MREIAWAHSSLNIKIVAAAWNVAVSLSHIYCVVCDLQGREDKYVEIFRLKARSRVVNTNRTILSPFTKEYHVLATLSGIRLFLESSISSIDVEANNINYKLDLDSYNKSGYLNNL